MMIRIRRQVRSCLLHNHLVMLNNSSSVARIISVLANKIISYSLTSSIGLPMIIHLTTTNFINGMETTSGIIIVISCVVLISYYISKI